MIKFTQTATLAAIALLSATTWAAPALASESTPEPVIVPAPAAGKGQVVFFRKSGFAGSAISCAVAENGTKISSLPPGRFFILSTEAGHHTFSVSSDAKDEVFFDVKPGQTKYVSCHVEVGFWVGRPKLEAVLEETMIEQQFSTKPWKMVEKARMGPGVMTDDQIKAALAMQTPPDANAATGTAPMQPASAAPALTAPSAAPAATTIPAVATAPSVAPMPAPATKH